jgi:hypothetical protein
MNTNWRTGVVVLLLLQIIGCRQNRFSPVAQSPNIRFDNVTAQNCWAGNSLDNPISPDGQEYLNDLLMRNIAEGKSAEEAGKIQMQARKSMSLPLCSDLANAPSP